MPASVKNQLGHTSRSSRFPAVLELIPEQRTGSFRWHQHDYPAPVARWNYHPEYELHLITHGSGQAMIGDHIGKFSARQLVLIGPDLPHAWFSPLAEAETLSGRDVVLQFSQAWIDGLVGLCPELSGMTRMLSESLYGLEFLGSHALECGFLLEKMGQESGGVQLGKCIELLSALSSGSWKRLATRRDAVSPDASGSCRINRLIRHMLASDPSEIRHEMLAASVGMSASTFSRQFRLITGETVMSFLQKLRIGHACHLLTTTTMAITDICRASGFGNLSNFNRVFLALRGCTPRQFRQNSQKIAYRFTGLSPDEATNGGLSVS